MSLPDLKSISINLPIGIIVRSYLQDDAKSVYETVKRNEEHLAEFMNWMTPDYSLDTAREFIARSIEMAEKKEALTLGIFNGKKHIGSTGFVYLNPSSRKTEIGYWIDKNEEGKGIVSLTTRGLIDLAFTKFEMNRIEIRCSTENKKSALIPRRIGFLLDGTLRQSENIHGRLHDFYVFSLLKQDWTS